MDPTTTATVYAGADAGVFKTVDGGNTWHAVNSGFVGGRVYGGLAMDPHDPAVIYAATDEGVFKTIDGGAMWAQSTPWRSLIYSVAVDAVAPGRVYAATGFSLWRSDDAGTTWIEVALPAQLQGWGVQGVVSQPGRSGVVYVFGERGAYRSTDGGATWNQLIPGDPPLTAFAIDRTGVVVAGNWDGAIWRGSEGGTSWLSSTVDNDLLVHLQSVVLLPTDPMIACAATASGGIYVSVDGGASWRPSNQGLTNTFVSSVQVDSPGGLFVGTLLWGAFYSPDGGASWTAMRSGMPFWATGEEYTPDFWVTVIRRDPVNASHLWAGTSRGLYETTDGGASWAELWFRYGISSLLLHPAIPGTMFAGVGLGNGWPSLGGGVFKSVDGGKQWSELTASLGSPAVYCLVMDPSNLSVLLAGSNQRVLRSTDGGATWTATGAGVFERYTQVTGIAFQAGHSERVLAAAGRAVFASDDGGQTWSRTSPELPGGGCPIPGCMYVLDVVCDPRVVGACYAATAFGVYRTLDGGTTWSSYSDGLTNTAVWSIALDPSGHKLFAGTYGGGVFVIEPTIPAYRPPRRHIPQRSP